MELAGIEQVSWDVDGTLYSLVRLRLAIAQRALARAPFGTWRGDLDELRELAAWRARMERVRAAGGRYGGPYAERERVRALERVWYGEALARVGPRPEIARLQAELRARGVRQIVLSDYESDYKLDALGLTGTFDAVYSGEAVGWLKPSEELYRQVARATGVLPARWLHIGDRVDRDERPARAVGCRTLILGRDRLTF